MPIVCYLGYNNNFYTQLLKRAVPFPSWGFTLPSVHPPPKASNQNKWHHASITNRQQIHSLIRLPTIEWMWRCANRKLSQSIEGQEFSNLYLSCNLPLSNSLSLFVSISLPLTLSFSIHIALSLSLFLFTTHHLSRLAINRQLAHFFGVSTILQISTASFIYAFIRSIIHHSLYRPHPIRTLSHTRAQM